MKTKSIMILALAACCVGELPAVPAQRAVPGLPEPHEIERVSESGDNRKSWLTVDRMKEARDMILEGGQKKKPFFMDREVPCLRDAYLLSDPGDDKVVIFLQFREVIFTGTKAQNRAVPGKGILVVADSGRPGDALGRDVLMQAYGMEREASSADELPDWVSLFLPMRGRVESVAREGNADDVVRCSLEGDDPLLNCSNAKTIARYVFMQKPRRAIHGSLYGSLPYYPIKGTPYAVFLMPQGGAFSPIDKPEDVGGLDFCYQGKPGGVGSVSVGWKADWGGRGDDGAKDREIYWSGWHPAQYMQDMSCEAFLYLLREMKGEHVDSWLEKSSSTEKPK